MTVTLLNVVTVEETHGMKHILLTMSIFLNFIKDCVDISINIDFFILFITDADYLCLYVQ